MTKAADKPESVRFGSVISGERICGGSLSLPVPRRWPRSPDSCRPPRSLLGRDATSRFAKGLRRHVLQAHLHRVETELAGYEVHDAPDHVGRLGPSSPAERIGRHLIRMNAGDVCPNGLELVAAAEHEPVNVGIAGVRSWQYEPTAAIILDRIASTVPSFLYRGCPRKNTGFVPTITKEGSAEFSNIRRCFHPARRFRIEITFLSRNDRCAI
jgi:hypothetical protein